MQNKNHAHQHKNCIKKALDHANIICDKKSLNLTSTRKKVLEIILSNKHSAIKAYDILKKLNSDKPPTVYRALDFLLENKIIHKINSLNGYIACYQQRAGGNCCFFICVKCKNIFEHGGKKIRSDINSIAVRKKVKIKNVGLEITVECDNC